MPCTRYEDNEGAIQIAKHPISNSNSKHIDVRYHFLRELIERKEIEIIPVASHRLEVVAVAGLLWISWCVLGVTGFTSCFL